MTDIHSVFSSSFHEAADKEIYLKVWHLTALYFVNVL